MRAIVATLIASIYFGGCGPEKQPSPPAKTAGSAAPAAVEADPAAPPSPAVQEERLAAIQKAMNDLAPASQQCWAAAATDRFDIEGELTTQIDIAAGRAQVRLIRDTARNTRLSACVAQLLSAYRWAPPLVGQSIQLPFKFTAPDGQNTIDRALVAWSAQGTGASRVAVRVLLDENNTGSDAASMFEVAIAAGGTTGPRWSDRAELWYFLAAGEIRGVRGASRAVAAGDMMYVPKAGAREVRATAGELRAMITVVPGGREGAARGGALPNREAINYDKPPRDPVVLPASDAKTFGPATIFSDALHDPTLAASILHLPAGGAVPPHVHAAETEVLYVLAGSGTMTVGGVALPVTPTSVVQIPRGVQHGFAATSDFRAVQIYTPGGPEQRFKARP